MISSKRLELNTDSDDQTIAIGKKLGTNLKGGEVIELVSDLGGGKTTLVKGIALGVGSKDLVSSPTFTLCNEYQGKKLKIYHFDFYRLSDPGIMRRELSEVIDSKTNVIIIEWPAVVANILPEIRIAINIEAPEENKRTLNMTYPTQLKYLTTNL